MEGTDVHGESSGKVHMEYNIDYLEIPMLGKMYLVDNRAVSPFLIAGPAVSVKLSEKYKSRYENRSGSSDSHNFESRDFGLIVGGGVEFSRFLVEARVNFGLTRANKTANEDFLTIKNRVISVLGGFRF